MNKQSEIKEVKDQMRELADKLEALETVEEPKREPKAGDVYAIGDEARLLVTDGRLTHIGGGLAGMLCHETSVNQRKVNDGDATYLGTFKEVYMLRSEAPEQDENLLHELLNWRDSEGLPMTHRDSCDHEVAQYLYELLKD